MHRAFHQAQQDRRQSGSVPPAFYGLDSMVHKAFRRIDCQNIQQVYEFRNYLDITEDRGCISQRIQVDDGQEEARQDGNGDIRTGNQVIHGRVKAAHRGFHQK